jgi:two-component system, NtrC family, response regulator GlrR
MSTEPLSAIGARADSVRPFTLTVLSGVDAGLRVMVVDELVIGSGATAGLTLKDPSVSREHVRVRLSPLGAHVTDLGSTNGTRLAGFPTTAFLVRAEASFRVGRTVLKLECVSQERLEVDQLGEATSSSPAMRRVFAAVRQAARSPAAVLFTGETGTGKDVMARALHEASSRSQGPFVVVDCASLSAELIEAELFGHTRGAFTGATSARPGLLLEADRGTLLLDEVGELPLPLQSRFLRFLTDAMVRPVGATEAKKVDVRVVAATHRDLRAMSDSGTFRVDLYYRLAAVHIELPPLRARPEDLELLFMSLLEREGHGDFRPSPELLAHLHGHSWPGNVRELRNFVQRIVSGGQLEARSMPSDSTHFKAAKETLLDAFTRHYFTDLYERCEGNVSEVARLSGLARPWVHQVLKRLGVHTIRES